MAQAFLKNDMRGAFGAKDDEEGIGHYSVDFREVIPAEEFELASTDGRQWNACQLKIDFHGKGAPLGGAQMFITLDATDVEPLVQEIVKAYKAWKEYRDAHPPMKDCPDCKDANGVPTGCKKGITNVPPEKLEMCETCRGAGQVRA